MHWWQLVLSLAELESAELLDKVGELSLDIVLVVVINLKSHVLDLVLLESEHVLLGCYEEWQRNVEQNFLDVGLDHHSGLFKFHALGKELD